MTKIQKYKFNQEVEMMLEYFVPHINRASTKEQAKDSVDTLTIVLELIVEKYYGDK